MLISFILLAFPSSSFVCIWLLEFAIACCLYLFVPFEEKLDFSTRWVVFFFHYFFPVSPIGCWVTFPCFLHIYIVFVTPLHLFWYIPWSFCWTDGVDFFAFTFVPCCLFPCSPMAPVPAPFVSLLPATHTRSLFNQLKRVQHKYLRFASHLEFLQQLKANHSIPAGLVVRSSANLHHHTCFTAKAANYSSCLFLNHGYCSSGLLYQHHFLYSEIPGTG